MSKRPLTRLCSLGGIVGLIILAVVVSSVTPAPANAADLSMGQFRFLVDTTLSWGARWRLDDRDLRIIGLPEGGTAYSVNGDDGNLNFDTGLASNAVKATVDIDLAYKNVGAFFRGTGFYDFEVKKAGARTPLSQARPWTGSADAPSCSMPMSGGSSISAVAEVNSGAASRC